MPSDRTVIVAGGGDSGQTQIREETTASELALPVRQWRTLVALRVLLAVAHGSIFLVWSPWSFYALGVVLIALLILRIEEDDEHWGRYYCKWRGGNDATARIARAIVAPCLLVAWCIVGDDVLAMMWPERVDLILFSLPLRGLWRLHIFWRLMATVPSGVLIWSYPDLAYRMRAEVTDPSWSAPIAPRAPDTGPAFPGAEIRSAGAEPPPPQIVEKPYPVPMPVPTRSGNHKMLPPEPVYDSGYKSVFAPSGREISVSDLTTFVRMALKIGTSSHAWKERQWQHERWQDAVDTWAQFSIIGEREDRKKPEILKAEGVSDDDFFTLAMSRLSTWLNTPTPQED